MENYFTLTSQCHINALPRAYLISTVPLKNPVFMRPPEAIFVSRQPAVGSRGIRQMSMQAWPPGSLLAEIHRIF